MSKPKKQGWTIETYALHNEAMRVVQQKFENERDRRYTEGNELRAMALKIKETADRDALELDRASQTYKEARNDALREQNLKETGIYATHADVALMADKIYKALEPLTEYISAQKGIVKGNQITMGKIYSAIAAVSAVVGTVVGILVYLATKN